MLFTLLKHSALLLVDINITFLPAVLRTRFAIPHAEVVVQLGKLVADVARYGDNARDSHTQLIIAGISKHIGSGRAPHRALASLPMGF
jgi:hypothetical protein